MTFQSINPYTQEIIAEYPRLTETQIDQRLAIAEKAYRSWKKSHFSERSTIIRKVGQLLKEKAKELAPLVTREMGKTLTEAKAEIEKCALVCEYYAENGGGFLQPKTIVTDFSKSYVLYQPKGAVFAVMPWNFPFWQVFRYSVPTIMAGNVTLLKHAPNVFGSAQAIEQLWMEAGLPEGVFQSLTMHHEDSEKVISHPIVQGVTLTGSKRAGSSVASLAGKNIKHSVLELGGSDAFIVLADADVEAAAEQAVKSRFGNCGQTCIAAKRFLLEKSVADKFTDIMLQKINALKVGDPMSTETTTGPMARVDLAQNLDRQVKASVEKGAVLSGGGYEGKAIFHPGVLLSVKPDMPAFNEELFGPVAAISVVNSPEEAIDLANRSEYGLGANLWTKDLDKAAHFASQLEAGNVFVNSFVKSDPRLPFGGIKQSGYGRELSEEGIKEFVNIKTVAIQ